MTHAPSRRAWLAWGLLAIVWFGTLGVRDIVHSDEGRYSEISREMAQSGDWVTPRLNGLKYFEKPPLQYWATATAFKAFGTSDFTARLWVGLCGFLTLVVLWRTARRLWDEPTAHCAALAGASMVYLGVFSHAVTLDMGVSFFLTLALCGFLLAQHDGASPAESRRYMLLTWAAMAGAALSKGLIGVVIPGAVLVLYSLLCRHWEPWRRMQWLPGLLIFLALAAPWHVLVARGNPEWAQFYFVHEHFERFLTTEHNRAGAWYYFVPLLLIGLLPWTGWLPAIAKQGWAPQPGRFQLNRFLLIWAGFIFVFFSMSGSKLQGYLLPVFPALALLLAPLLARAGLPTLRKQALGLALFWLLLAAAAPLVGQRGSERTPHEIYLALSWWLLAGGLSCAVLAAAAAWRTLRSAERAAADATLLIACSGLVFMVTANFGYQLFSPLRSSRQVAEVLRPGLDADTPVFSVAEYDQTLPYYLGRTVTLVDYVGEFEMGQQQEPGKYVPTLEEFARRWREAPRAVAVTSVDDYDTRVVPLGLPMREIYRDPRRVAVEKPQTP